VDVHPEQSVPPSVPVERSSRWSRWSLPAMAIVCLLVIAGSVRAADGQYIANNTPHPGDSRPRTSSRLDEQPEPLVAIFLSASACRRADACFRKRHFNLAILESHRRKQHHNSLEETPPALS
jgi:hypothetical protein